MWNQIKKTTARRAGSVLAAVLALSTANALPANWVTDLPSAQASAKAQNKMVLINFTGSDWCGWCIRLRNEVFSKPEFDAFAQDNLVLVEADFPREKAQTAELRQANAALAEQFQIRGYPTIVLLNSEGKKLGALGYAPGGPQAFISELTRISETKAAPSSPSHVKAKKVDDTPPPPLFNGAPSFPPPKFNDLVLKGISGSKNHRLVMINNKTFEAGEVVSMTLGDREVRVKCVEIREDSVLVSVDGAETREVRIRGGL